jgi:hypothetical protein
VSERESLFILLPINRDVKSRERQNAGYIPAPADAET